MDAIDHYLDELFADYPADESIISSVRAAARSELTSLYKAAISSGASPGKAFETAKSQFGVKEFISYYSLLKKENDTYDLFMAGYKKRIRAGVACIFVIPLIFMILMLIQDSKMIFLTLWIVSILAIAAYLIFLEYLKEKWTQTRNEHRGENL